MRYWPNPAHKTETTEAGPPRWYPAKTKCPALSVAERGALLKRSVPQDPGDRTSRRFAIRRGESGLEFFEARCTREAEGELEFHGYPTTHVPSRVLRKFKDAGLITEAEYRRAVRDLAKA